jgi:hypothetical protein
MGSGGEHVGHFVCPHLTVALTQRRDSLLIAAREFSSSPR